MAAAPQVQVCAGLCQPLGDRTRLAAAVVGEIRAPKGNRSTSGISLRHEQNRVRNSDVLQSGG